MTGGAECAAGKGLKKTLVVTLVKAHFQEGTVLWHSLLKGHASMFESNDPTAKKPGA